MTCDTERSSPTEYARRLLIEYCSAESVHVVGGWYFYYCICPPVANVSRADEFFGWLFCAGPIPKVCGYSRCINISFQVRGGILQAVKKIDRFTEMATGASTKVPDSTDRLQNIKNSGSIMAIKFGRYLFSNSISNEFVNSERTCSAEVQRIRLVLKCTD